MGAGSRLPPMETGQAGQLRCSRTLGPVVLQLAPMIPPEMCSKEYRPNSVLARRAD
jgi:hypothetical protein